MNAVLCSVMLLVGQPPSGGEPPAAPVPPEAPAAEPWPIMRILQGTPFGDRLARHGITIEGWTEGNFTYGSQGPSNYPVTFNDRRDFWQMNQNYLRITRPVDTSRSERQVGFGMDWILPGTDARFTIARGLLDSQLTAGPNGGPVAYPIDLFQVYADTFLPNLGPRGTTVRVGKFASLIGYEMVQAVETPFVSRSFVPPFHPFTHSGALATTVLDDTWSVANGLVLGADNFFGAVAQPTYIGQLKWAPKDGKSTAAFNVMVTDPTFNVPANFAFYNTYNLILTHQFTDRFKGVIDTIASHMDGVPGAGTTWWYGAVGYGIYQLSDKVTATLRGELFDDNRGIRTGSRGLYGEVTFGLACAPVRSVIVRPSVRYDTNFESRPWNGSRNLLTAVMDVIIRW